MNAGLILRLPLGLAIIFALAILIWFELLFSAAMRIARRGRGRGRPARDAQIRAKGRSSARSAAVDDELAQLQDAETEDPDPARRLYLLGRQTARAERDAAIAAVDRAAEQAAERIEQRYRELDESLIAEEVERSEEAGEQQDDYRYRR